MRRFQEQGCKVHCCVCALKNMPLDFSFDMQTQGALITSAVYGKYLACTRECEVIDAQKDLAERLRAAHAELEALKNPTGIPTEARVRDITRLIGEALVLPSCPACKKSFVDFDGCCGLTCTFCKANYCGWCLELCPCSDTCHEHVRQCPFNPPANRSVVYTRYVYGVCVPHITHRGKLYPPQPHPFTWQQVMNEAARKRINEYIMTEVEDDLRELVHNAVRTEHPQLCLQNFGTVLSDGFREPPPKRPPKIPTLEENVTSLQAMGLADRTRALQVLEASANDLDAAVNLLLAIQNNNE
jgi:hypothetical protein